MNKRNKIRGLLPNEWVKTAAVNATAIGRDFQTGDSHPACPQISREFWGF